MLPLPHKIWSKSHFIKILTWSHKKANLAMFAGDILTTRLLFLFLTKFATK